MRVLLVGSGGREHALAWSISKSPKLTKLYASPGSDAISEFAEIVSGDRPDVDLVIIGPEVPLAEGLADQLRGEGILVFGPNKDAARLESSKSFAKEFMVRHQIPTARSKTVNSLQEGKAALAEFTNGVVVKADGLAAGKGVIVCATREEAEAALTAKPAECLVLEEYLEGPEVSLLGLCDGKRFLALPTSSDHKRLLDGDRGPNTGGMGVIAPAPAWNEAMRARVESEIIQPTLLGLAKDGLDYRGLLYIGLMLTPEGPKVLEYNCRFGDPETQAVLPLLQSDLLQALAAAAGGDLSGEELRASGCAVTVVLASEGYPSKPISGRLISGLDLEELVFHAGTRNNGDHWITNGGRVLGVTGLGETHAQARERAYHAANKINFDGRQMRSDIGAALPTPA
ncbi:MAG: phosphoribosylamine--glycine ligase [Elusimicrobia bacterium]|nr:MAG: phosphoribosylamine--glycine ligase [Elusimicrobiota bacterium]